MTRQPFGRDRRMSEVAASSSGRSSGTGASRAARATTCVAQDPNTAVQQTRAPGGMLASGPAAATVPAMIATVAHAVIHNGSSIGPRRSRADGSWTNWSCC